MQLALAAGSLAGALAVATGAFGAHALKAKLSAEALAWWQTAVQYHFVHALALLAVGLLARQAPPSSLLSTAAAAFVAGLVLFSGSLYAMSLGAPRWLGAVAPLGGTAWIVAWCCLVAHALREA